jgi:hypothetical protein
MLIQKPAATGDTVSIKLISGEEIIGRLDEDNAEYIKLNRPKSVSIGAQGLGMMPFMFLGGADNVTIKHSHIIVMVLAEKSAADQYVQGTTGIALS